MTTRAKSIVSELTLALGLSVALMAALGCDGGRPAVESGDTDATVTGTVSNRAGEPIAAGTISFDPANVQRKMEMPRTAEIVDGKYTITTLTGVNQVNVTAEGQGTVFVESISFDVQSGENTFNIGPAELGELPDDMGNN